MSANTLWKYLNKSKITTSKHILNNLSHTYNLIELDDDAINL